ncbi:hypothetical protein FAI40_07540 [Acetobacteraceae bacterium]|nr:hypothetical protein FAI40_07540 [Acetobacteraceae bacterium]
MKYSRKFPALLGASFFVLTLTATSLGTVHADPTSTPPVPKNQNKAATSGSAPTEPDSAQQQGLNSSGNAATPTVPLNNNPPEDKNSALKALKDVDLKIGNWMGFEKKDDAGEIVSVCGAMNHENSPFRIMFRSAKTGLEIDAMNTTWNLPPNITGETTFSVGNYRTTLSMSQKNKMTLEATVTPQQLTPLLDALETSRKAILTFGAGRRYVVTLNGADKVLQNFRDCTLSHSFADIGGY